MLGSSCWPCCNPCNPWEMQSPPLRFVFSLDVQSANEFYAAYRYLYVWFYPSTARFYRGYALHVYSAEILPGDYLLENVFIDENVAVYESVSPGLRLRVTCTKKANGCWLGHVNVDLLGSVVIDAAYSGVPGNELFNSSRISPLQNSQILSTVPQIRSLNDIRVTADSPDLVTYQSPNRPFLSELVFFRNQQAFFSFGFRLDYQPGRQSGEDPEENDANAGEQGIFDVSSETSIHLYRSSGGVTSQLGRWPIVSTISATASTEEFTYNLFEYPPIYTNPNIYINDRVPFAIGNGLGQSAYSTGWGYEDISLFRRTQRTTSPFSWWESYLMKREFSRHFQINYVEAIYENSAKRWE